MVELSPPATKSEIIISSNDVRNAMSDAETIENFICGKVISKPEICSHLVIGRLFLVHIEFFNAENTIIKTNGIARVNDLKLNQKHFLQV